MVEEMFNENEPNERASSAWVRFGEGGHEYHYVLELEGFDIDNYIPSEIESELIKELGDDWDVENRGTRIEILNKKVHGSRDDEKIHDALKKVLAPRGYLLKE